MDDEAVVTNGWVAVAEVAAMTGRSERQVRNWIDAKKVRALRTAVGWRIHPDDVPALQRRGAQSADKPAPMAVVADQDQSGDDAATIQGLEMILLRSEVAQLRTELAAAAIVSNGKDRLIEERTKQLMATRSALRALVDVSSDPTDF
jgi:Helix-turn-helix domain